jgi:hypothetical protein
MKINARKRALQRVVLTTDLLAIDHEQWRAEARGKRADFSFRERRRVES